MTDKRRRSKPTTYEGKIAGYANKAWVDFNGLSGHLQLFAWSFMEAVQNDDDISDTDKMILTKRPVMAQMFRCYSKHGVVTESLVTTLLDKGRNTKATITLAKDTLDFINAFAKNNGVDPDDVMAEAVTQWYRRQEADAKSMMDAVGDLV